MASAPAAPARLGRGRRPDPVASGPRYHNELRAWVQLGETAGVVGGWIQALVRDHVRRSSIRDPARCLTRYFA